MIAISSSDFERFGCVNCGCDFSYNPGPVSGNGTFPAKCGECGTEFVILADGLKESGIGFGTGTSDVYTYPKLQAHPRKGISKHKFVRPDIRPENGIGEFCKSRGVGYDLACFVKSKEAGKRIVDMFDKIFEERKGTHKDCECFVCGKAPAWLDYRPSEPLWIQVKIQYCKDHEKNINVLSQLISEDGIITEEKIRMAMNIDWNFENTWKYDIRHKVYNATSSRFTKLLLKKEFEKLDEYKESSINFDFEWNGNVLAQFQTLGCFLQVDSLMKKGKFDLAYLAVAQYIDAISSRFTTTFKYKCQSTPNSYTRLKSCLKDFLFDNPYENENNFYCDFKGISTDVLYLFFEDKLKEIGIAPIFEAFWNNIVKKHVYEYANFKYLKEIAESDDFSNYDFSNTNIMSMFGAAGLYFTLNRIFEEKPKNTGEYKLKNAVFAIEQFNKTLTSKFNYEICKNDIEEGRLEKDRKLYMDLVVLMRFYK